MARLLPFFLLLFSTAAFAQAQHDCGDTFYDPGGPTGPYEPFDFATYVVCPTNGDPGDVVTVTFTQLAFAPGAGIDVTNGEDGDYLGTISAGVGATYQSTAADGCLEFTFFEFDGNGGIGFAADVSCGPGTNCLQPTIAFIDSRTMTSITLDWQENGTATLWDVALLTAGTSFNGTPTETGVTKAWTETGLTSGQEYDFYVRSNCGGSFSIWSGPYRVTPLPPPPANDECTSASALNASPDDNCANQVNASLLGSTPSTPGPACYLDATDLWYSFAATSQAMTVILNDPNFGEGDFVSMEILSGVCGTFTSLSCDEGSTVRVTNLTLNDTYFIRVFGDSGSEADFGICVVAEADPPANDDCPTASPLVVNASPECTSLLSVTTAGALESFPACNGPAADDDVWFSFTATNDVHLLYLDNVVSVTGFERDLVYEVFSGSCGSLTSVICEQFNSFADPPVFLTGLSAGIDYFIRVYTQGAGGTVDFDICLATPPLNDECSGAISLPVNPGYACDLVTAGSTTGASRSGADCGIARADDDVWYSFVATRTSHLMFLTDVVFTGGFNQTMYYELNVGSCGSLTPLECTFSSSPSELQGLIVGETYYLRIFSRINSGTASFNLCLASPPPNDECPEAIAAAVNPDLTNTVTTSGTSLGATESFEVTGSACSNSANDDDVWFSFTALATEHRVSLLNLMPVGGNFDDDELAVVRLWSGACGTLSEVGCGFADEDSDEVIFSGLTAGEVYFLAIQSRSFDNNLSFDLSIKTEPGLLPITLATFTGTALEKVNELKWVTSSEENTQWHVLERSHDGQDQWTEVARTQAAGFSNEEQSYVVTDQAPAPLSYYRLRSIDYDGSQQLSHLVMLERTNTEVFKLYPNPAGASVNVRLPEGMATDQLRMFDLYGREMPVLIDGNTLRLTNIPSGTYLLQVSQADGSKLTRRLVRR